MTTQPIGHQQESKSPSPLKPLDQERIQQVIQLLDSWCDVEEEVKEQCETLECLMKVLDEDRPSYRKLFP